ncbi:hypothetical protein L3Q82_020969 [Scortum barcoo]|uniref:Uncharacterized protein n=1 Tax=Scortum barcoo TaxID=214431 RepID=A0ACB8V9B8_9TELE|nr:hypothetical protein L3Q82_020969 [Scortum barcoo]
MQDNARPHVAGVCQQFLQDEGIDAMDWPARSPDLNPIEHIWDIMSRSIHQRHVAPQTVQELADALVQASARDKLLIGSSSAYKESDKGFIIIGAFKDGLAEGEISDVLQPISALRLVVQSDADVWALLSECSSYGLLNTLVLVCQRCHLVLMLR